MSTQHSASIYVGDLLVEVTEGTLFDLFGKLGSVASIRVCRDAVTRRSLGYGYVNFQNAVDAERAMDTLNFTEVKVNPLDPQSPGQPCRLMWSQRDPSMRRSGVGNLFVRNIPESMDNKSLFDTFSVFGHILSCKVAVDDRGVSKGYGYVHLDSANAAKEAIDKLNGTFIEGREVFVGLFVRRTERPQQLTNLYVKQFPLSWDEERLSDLFGSVGEVASLFIQRDAEGRSKGFGFVNYTDAAGADRALAELAGKVIEEVSTSSAAPAPAAGPTAAVAGDAEFEETILIGSDGDEATATATATATAPTSAPTEPSTSAFVLYVSRAQKKKERQKEIRGKLAAKSDEISNRYQGLNLYVKNIDESVTDEFFREIFAKYGTITSARIMREEDGASRGFGFVCYSNAEEAARAVSEQNGKILRSKPLFVALHQRKVQRQQLLASTFAPRPGMPAGRGGLRGAPSAVDGNRFRGGPVLSSTGMPVMYMQGASQGQSGFAPNVRMQPVVQSSFGYPVQQSQAMYMQQQSPQAINMMRGGPVMRPQQMNPRMMSAAQPGAMQPMHMQPMPMQQMQGFDPRQQQAQRRPQPGPPLPLNHQQQQQQPPMSMPLPMPQQNMQQGMSGQQQQARGQMSQEEQLYRQQQLQMQQMQQQQQRPNSQHQQSQQLEALARVDSQTQKNLLGERLYPIILQQQPALAGKITGMLLEMDNSELLHMLESPQALQSKVTEAIAVLREHANPN